MGKGTSLLTPRSRVVVAVCTVAVRMISVDSWMDLDHAAQRPLHGWYVILPEDYYGAFSDVVFALIPFVAAGQLVEVLSIPSAPEILFDLVNALPT